MWDVLKEYPAARVRLEAIAVKRLEKYKRAPLEKGEFFFISFLCVYAIIEGSIAFSFDVQLINLFRWYEIRFLNSEYGLRIYRVRRKLKLKMEL